MSSRTVLVMRRGSLTDPPVIMSVTDGPLPPSSQPPSYWLAAVAPPQRKPSGKVVVASLAFGM